MFSRVNAKAGVSRFPPPRPTDGSPRSNSPPSGPSSHPRDGPSTRPPRPSGSRTGHRRSRYPARACLPKPRAGAGSRAPSRAPLPGPLLSLRASVCPLAVGENLLQGGPLPPIDGEAIPWLSRARLGRRTSIDPEPVATRRRPWPSSRIDSPAVRPARGSPDPRRRRGGSSRGAAQRPESWASESATTCSMSVSFKLAKVCPVYRQRITPPSRLRILASTAGE